MLTVKVLPSAIVNVADVAGAVIATLLTEVALATPRVGVVSVGEVRVLFVSVWAVVRSAVVAVSMATVGTGPVADEIEMPVRFYSTIGDRFDLLAQQYYKDSSLWWIISTANETLPQNSLYILTGTQIRIPTDISNILNEEKIINNSESREIRQESRKKVKKYKQNLGN